MVRGAFVSFSLDFCPLSFVQRRQYRLALLRAQSRLIFYLVPLRFGHLCTDHGCSRSRTGLRVTPSAARNRDRRRRVRVLVALGTELHRYRMRIAFSRRISRLRTSMPPTPHTRSRLPNIRLFLYKVAFRAPCEQLQRARRRMLRQALGQACPGAESVRQTAPPRCKETSAI